MKTLTWMTPALLALTASFTVSLSTAQTAAPNYPQKPIRMIVTIEPGGAPDVGARVLAPVLGERLGQSVVVENRPGAGGTIGMAQVANPPADGLTLGVVSTGHVVNPVLYEKIPYDTIRDFAGVSPLGQLPSVLIVPREFGPKTVKELVALAKVAVPVTFKELVAVSEPRERAL